MQFLRQIFQNYQPRQQYQPPVNPGGYQPTSQPTEFGGGNPAFPQQTATPEQQYQNHGLTAALPNIQTTTPVLESNGYQPRLQPTEFGGGNPAPNLRQQQQVQPMRPRAAPTSSYQQPGGFRDNTGRMRRGGCF